MTVEGQRDSVGWMLVVRNMLTIAMLVALAAACSETPSAQGGSGTSASPPMGAGTGVAAGTGSAATAGTGSAGTGFVPTAGTGNAGGAGTAAAGVGGMGAAGTAGTAAAGTNAAGTGAAGTAAGTGAAGTAAGTGAGGMGTNSSASADALNELTAHLAMPRDQRPDIATQPFAQTPLTAADAEAARAALWNDLVSHVQATRMSEHQAKSITIDGFTLRYETVVLGNEPPEGRDLFISMHGGGSGPASTNDSQWQNQIQLASSYNPSDAIWVAPRAPTDDWNMWFKDHIDGLFGRLITNMIVFEGINPDRVYVNGYSAGGDGVYGLSPRSADMWAGAGMSAGHPNGVSLANLRNVAFALHVGGDDTSFDRNLEGQRYIDMHMDLQAADPDGYPFQGMVHPGLPHWMNLADAVSIPFMQGYTRSAVPDRVVWEQHPVKASRMYWLAIDPSAAQDGTSVIASYQGQTLTVEDAQTLSSLRIRINDAMLDMDQPITVTFEGATLFEGNVERTIATLAATLAEREDPSLVYSGEVVVDL